MHHARRWFVSAVKLDQQFFQKCRSKKKITIEMKEYWTMINASKMPSRTSQVKWDKIFQGYWLRYACIEKFPNQRKCSLEILSEQSHRTKAIFLRIQLFINKQTNKLVMWNRFSANRMSDDSPYSVPYKAWPQWPIAASSVTIPRKRALKKKQPNKLIMRCVTYRRRAKNHRQTIRPVQIPSVIWSTFAESGTFPSPSE